MFWIEQKLTRKQRSVQQLLHKCQIIGEYAMSRSLIMDYKTLADATDEEVEAICTYIDDAVGINREDELTVEQHKLLMDKGYIFEVSQ